MRASAEQASTLQSGAIQPADVAHVVTTLDGSADAMRAVPIAQQLAERLGAHLTVIGVVGHGGDPGSLQEHVDRAAAGAGGDAVVVEGNDVVDAVVSVAGRLPRHVVCMASHGRGRSAGVIGSVAAGLATRVRHPLVLVGPNVPDDHRLDGRMVACVDGDEPSESVLATAAPWAVGLGLRLSVVTVAEPVPEPIAGSSYHRSHGPSVVAEEYVGRLARQWDSRGLDVEGVAVYDPVSVAGGLADHLESRPAALVAVTTHARTGVARVVLGSVAADIVHRVPAPVLLVPLPV